MIKVETSSLRNGVAMPKIGLGTFPCKGEELVQGIASAIALGYRAFDTGTHYENEPDIAAGIRLSGEDRKNLFITSKFWNVNPGYDHAMRAFENSLKLLETDYVDLYLIHFPNLALHVETWRALEQIYKDKRARAIGVSNFLPHHLEVLKDNCEIIPMVNQIEAHPYYLDLRTIEYCRRNSIQVEAYCPLACPGICGTSLLQEPIVENIAKRHGKKPAQVVLRYLLQLDIIPIPKTMNPKRQAENLDVFDFTLTQEDIKQMEVLNCKKRLSFDPDTFVGE